MSHISTSTATTAAPSRRHLGEAGQTTAEYALVLLGAAAIAMLMVAWAGQTGAIGAFFDAVMESLTGLVA
jgi:hypothetical protein